MFYYIFEYLEKLNIPGAGMFQYISFRSGLSIITSLLISMLFGKSIIRMLQKKQIGETIRDLGLEGQLRKEGTPTMGGLIIIFSIIVPVILFAKLDNIYIILMIVTTIWLGFIGFLDDYIKVFKKNKQGLAGKFKIVGQIALGIYVGVTLFMSEDAVIRERIKVEDIKFAQEITEEEGDTSDQTQYVYQDVKSTKTTIPFFKDNEGDYANLLPFLKEETAKKWAWVLFVIVVIFIITAVSNSANMTDGLDGLATGSSAIMAVTLGVLAYLSGNVIYAEYLNIMYIPDTGEIVVFIAAFLGAAIGFLWYNSYPAQVFMGDTGSLSLGGIIAVIAIVIHKELLIPILCGIFFIESLSVIIQVSYFKHTKKKYGEGRRVFKMAPLHHHYQKLGMPEAKIVTRFWIVGLILAVITIVTLKIR